MHFLIIVLQHLLRALTYLLGSEGTLGAEPLYRWREDWYVIPGCAAWQCAAVPGVGWMTGRHLPVGVTSPPPWRGLGARFGGFPPEFGRTPRFE